MRSELDRCGAGEHWTRGRWKEAAAERLDFIRFRDLEHLELIDREIRRHMRDALAPKEELAGAGACVPGDR